MLHTVFQCCVHRCLKVGYGQVAMVTSWRDCCFLSLLPLRHLSSNWWFSCDVTKILKLKLRTPQSSSQYFLLTREINLQQKFRADILLSFTNTALWSISWQPKGYWFFSKCHKTSIFNVLFNFQLWYCQSVKMSKCHPQSWGELRRRPYLSIRSLVIIWKLFSL